MALVSIKLGKTMPILYGFKKHRDIDNFRVYTIDITYDGDASAQLTAVGLTFDITKVKLSGRMLIRLDKSTSEVLVAFARPPMLAIHVAGPSKMKNQTISEALQNVLLSTCVVPHWVQCGSLFSFLTPRQEMLAFYQSRSPYSSAAERALEAALAALSYVQDDEQVESFAEHPSSAEEGVAAEELVGEFVVIDEVHGSGASSIGVVEAAHSEAAKSDVVVAPVGTICLSQGAISLCDMQGRVYSNVGASATTTLACLQDACVGCPVAHGTPPTAVHASDAHGSGVAWMTAGGKVLLAFRASRWWSWKEISTPENEVVVAVPCLIAADEKDPMPQWNIVSISSEGKVFAHSSAPWDARSQWHTTRLMLSSKCTQVVALAKGVRGVVCVTEK